MNAPERTATFLLDEDSGEQKIVYTADTKIANRYEDLLLARHALCISLKDGCCIVFFFLIL